MPGTVILVKGSELGILLHGHAVKVLSKRVFLAIHLGRSQS